MSASISVSGFIKSSGVTVENEPIIKSDGSGEIMQWQPSDGGADGIYIVEGGSAGDPARLGIGVAAPVKPLHIVGSSRFETTIDPTIQLKRTGNAAGNGSIECLGSDDSVDYAITFAGTTAGAMQFSTAAADALTIDGSGNVSVGTSTATKLLTLKKDGGGSQLGIDIHNSGTAAGDDAVISYECQGVAEWVTGVDRSASSFVIAGSGADLATNPRLTVDSSGNVSVNTTGGADQKRTLNIHGTNGSSELYTFAIEADGENAKTNFKVGVGGGAAATKLTIASDGNIEQHTDSNGIVKFGVKNESTGTSARAMVNILSDHGNLDLSMNGTNYTGVTGWADSGVVSTGSVVSGGLKLNAVAGGLALQTNQTTRLSIANSTGAVTVQGGTGDGDGNNAELNFQRTSSTGNVLETKLIFDDADTNFGDLVFKAKTTASSGAGSFTEAMRIVGSTGAVTFPVGTLTVGSLDIGHGANGDTASTAVGQNALDANGSATTAVGNTAIGDGALTALNHNDADYNTMVGRNAGSSITSGDRNVGVGASALLNSDTGTGNTAVGTNSLGADCADDNVAIGYNTLVAFTGSDATAVGSGAADALTTGAFNTAVGKNALGATDDGGYNTAIGNAALSANCADNNVAVGHAALNTFTGSNAVAVGVGAADAATSAANLTAIGYAAGGALVDQPNNTFIGYQSGLKTLGESNTFVGINSGAFADDVDHCVAIGRNALLGVDDGTNDGDYNIAIGSYALDATTSGNSNVAVGYNAGTDLTTGYRNVLLGYGAGANVTDNYTNVAIGHNAFLAANTGENYNIAIGGNALYNETSGADGCVAIGYNAMIGQNADVDNTAVGHEALFHNKAGTGSTALGYQAGNANVDSYNTWIGQWAGVNTGHAAANTVVGYRAYNSASFSDGTCDLNGSTTITCDSSADIAVGQSVTGSGIPYGAYVATVNSAGSVTSFTINEAATTTANNQTLTFYQGTGDSNTCIGYTAGEDITTGAENVCIGRDAGKNFTDNNYNVAIGAYAMDAANVGESANVAIGYAALSSETSGADFCVAVGHNALLNQNGNVKNTAIGGYAGDAITSGTSNTFVGYAAGSAVTDHSNNTFIGNTAGEASTGANNVAVGSMAFKASGTADNNICVGYSAGAAITDGPGNVLIGHNAGTAMTTGDYNVAIGYQAADSLAGNSDYNIAIGVNALGAEDLASNNVAIGSYALATQNDASAINMAIGTEAGDAINSGKQHVLIGHQAGSALTSNDACTALGYQALTAATGNSNTAIGASAMTGACTGSGNVAVGASALGSAANSETHNVAIGNAALYHLAHNDGDKNIAIGSDAGRFYEDTASTTPGSATPDGNNTAGSDSIFIGYDTRASESDRSNEIVIGHTAVGNGSNTITLGNDDTTSIHCADTSISALSDRRIKRDITDNNVGLDFVEKLATINYKRLNPADWPAEIRSHRYRVEEHQELVTPAVEAAEAVYEDVVVVEAREAVEEVTETIEHPAQEEVWEDVIIPAVEELKEEQVTQHAREEETEERVVQEAQEEITEERIVQEAREEVKGERHKHDEKEVTEEVEKVEMVKGEGNNYIRKVTTETVTRIERTPLYVDHPVVNEDGTPCLNIISPAVEAKEAVTREVPAVTEERQKLDEEGNGVVDEEGNAVMETVEVEPARTEIVEPAVEAKAAVTEQVIHQCPVREEYVIQEAQEEKRETVVVQEAREEKRETVVIQEAQEEVREMVVVREAEPERTERRKVQDAIPARTEVRVITPAEPAVEEVVERRLVKEAVEAQEAVYKTVTVPADERPDDDDTVRLGLVAQDVQTAMADAGVEFDLVTKGANGKLAVKYSNLVIPLLKAVQELSAEVKALKG